MAEHTKYEAKGFENDGEKQILVNVIHSGAWRYMMMLVRVHMCTNDVQRVNN